MTAIQKISVLAAALVVCTLICGAAVLFNLGGGADSVDTCRWWGVIQLLSAVGFGAFLGMSLYRLLGSLGRLSVELRETAQRCTGVAGQVAASSQSLARNASEQAASLEEVSASAQETNGYTQQNAETATALVAAMNAAVPVAQRMDASLGGMTGSMTKLTGSSQKIASVVKVIDEIAFQTNILALNAAVEAARSGAAGLSFAVVADEVRNLAQRSANAAKETGTLIEESVSMVREASAKLDDLLAASKANSSNAGSVYEMVGRVASGNEQQARSMREIAGTLPQIEQITQHVAAGAEESAAAGQELKSQIESLVELAAQVEMLAGLG